MSFAPIEVRISKRKLKELDHEIHIANFTMNALRVAGIPVVGALFPTRVETGVLQFEDDELSGAEVVWTWKP